MPRIFVRSFSVPDDAVDTLGHVNNLAYLRWMQDVALEHSAANGWPLERYQRTGAAWVVRSHTIEYLRPSFAGDTVSLLTWVAAFHPRSSPRRFLFQRAAGRQVLAQAETMWVFVDLRTGRPVTVPDELRSAFDIVPDDDPELMSLRHDGPAGPPVPERA